MTPRSAGVCGPNDDGASVCVRCCRWGRVRAAALNLHRVARGFLGRRLCDHARVVRAQVVAEVMRHDVLAAVVFSVVGVNFRGIRRRQTCHRVFLAWARHTLVLRVAGQLFGVKTKGALRECVTLVTVVASAPAMPDVRTYPFAALSWRTGAFNGGRWPHGSRLGSSASHAPSERGGIAACRRTHCWLGAWSPTVKPVSSAWCAATCRPSTRLPSTRGWRRSSNGTGRLLASRRGGRGSTTVARPTLRLRSNGAPSCNNTCWPGWGAGVVLAT